MKNVLIIGGGISGLAAAYRLHKTDPTVPFVLLEREERLGGKVVTDYVDGLIVEQAPDSFLTRKPRGIGLCEELHIADQLYGRRPEHADKTKVRFADDFFPLPSGLSGMIPTDLEALANNPLISPEGQKRLAQEATIPPEPENGDESVATFVSRRLGPEVYEKLVEPLMSGIYAGDGEQLSLAATFPQLRQLELKHGSLLNGLQAASASAQAAKKQRSATDYPPFASLTGGMGKLVDAMAATLPGQALRTGVTVTEIEAQSDGYQITLDSGERLTAGALVIATPAFVTAELLAPIDSVLADAHAAIPYASSAIVTLAYRKSDLSSIPEGYGYVVPSIAGSDVLACTWSSNKWAGRAPEDLLLLRVYIGHYGGRDVTELPDDELLALAQTELAGSFEADGEPLFNRIYRWPRSMPQYNLGHVERLATIAERLPYNPGLFLAGAAYRGVGIPDCIREGENAAESALGYLNNQSYFARQ